MAAGNENATICQQLAECKALTKRNAGDAETQIAAILALKDADIEVCRQQACDQSASNERAVADLRAELNKVREEANSYRAIRENETEGLLSQFGIKNAEKDSELVELRSENLALAAKLADMEKLRKEHAERSPPQTLSIVIFEASSTTPKHIDSEAQKPTEEMLELRQQLADKSAYLEAAYTELYSIKSEWHKTYPAIQESNDNWVTIDRRLGKTKFDCMHKIEAMRQGDPESKYLNEVYVFALTIIQ